VKAPLSLACFQQCYFVEGNRADPETHLPTSATYQAIAKEAEKSGDVNQTLWFQDISQSLVTCASDEEAGKLYDMTIDDDSMGKDTGFNVDTCKKALRLSVCLNRYLKTDDWTDREAFDLLLEEVGLKPKVGEHGITLADEPNDPVLGLNIDQHEPEGDAQLPVVPPAGSDVPK